MIDLGSAWEPVPAVIVGSALALALFAQGFVRLRRRGRRDHASSWRAIAFVAGLGVLALALVSPLDAIGEQYLLSGHMLQHVLIGDLAPALLFLAVSGPLVFFFLPRPVLGPVARSRSTRAVFRFLTTPQVAVVAWVLVLAVWHVPALYQHALTSPWTHDLEHASFVVAGLLVWYQLLDPTRRGALRRSGRLALAVALFAAGQVLTMVLVFSFEPLYGAYAGQDERLLGLTPITDQRLAGAVMMVEQAITLGTLAVFLLLAADREQRTRPAAGAVSAAPRP